MSFNWPINWQVSEKMKYLANKLWGITDIMKYLKLRKAILG